MKRRIVLALSLLCLCVSAWAQSSLQFLNSDPSKLPFENVWMVKYSSAQAMGTEVVLALELRKNGKLIYEAKTQSVPTTSGIQILDPSKLTKSSETFLDRNVGEFVQNANALPSGTYAACVYVMSNGLQPLTSCLEFSVDNTHQLRLLHVADGKKVEAEKLPVFSWAYMSASLNRADVQYEFTLCEILKGQSKEDALLRNIPHLKVANLPSNTLQYPIDARKLELDKQYAWAVKAMTGSTVLAHSEIWSFSVTEEEKQNNPRATMSYLDLGEYHNNNVIHVSGDVFKLMFDHSSNSRPELNFSVINETGKAVPSEFPPFQLKYGLNYITLDLSQTKRLKSNEQYKLLIVGIEDEDYAVNFTYTRN